MPEQLSRTYAGKDLETPATSALHLSTAQWHCPEAALLWGGRLEDTALQQPGTKLSANRTWTFLTEDLQLEMSLPSDSALECSDFRPSKYLSKRVACQEHMQPRVQEAAVQSG